MLINKDIVKSYSLITTRFRNLQTSKLITDEFNFSKIKKKKFEHGLKVSEKNLSYCWIQAAKISCI